MASQIMHLFFWAILETPLTSVSKQVLVHNLLHVNGNKIYLHACSFADPTHFHNRRQCTETRFKREVKNNLVMAYCAFILINLMHFWGGTGACTLMQYIHSGGVLCIP